MSGGRREHGLLLQDDLVRAAKARRKRETRRLPGRQNAELQHDPRHAKPLWSDLDLASARPGEPSGDGRPTMVVDVRAREGVDLPKVATLVCRVAPGDLLWVRVAFNPHYFGHRKPGYRADWDVRAADLVPEPKWTPSIHMPRWAARLEYTVTSVAVERVRDITEGAAQREGMPALPSARDAFAAKWDETVPAGSPKSWDKNPCVWVYRWA